MAITKWSIGSERRSGWQAVMARRRSTRLNRAPEPRRFTQRPRRGFALSVATLVTFAEHKKKPRREAGAKGEQGSVRAYPPSKAVAKSAERPRRKSPAASGAKFWAFSSHAEGYFRRKAILAARNRSATF